MRTSWWLAEILALRLFQYRSIKEGVHGISGPQAFVYQMNGDLIQDRRFSSAQWRIKWRTSDDLMGERFQSLATSRSLLRSILLSYGRMHVSPRGIPPKYFHGIICGRRDALLQYHVPSETSQLCYRICLGAYEVFCANDRNRLQIILCERSGHEAKKHLEEDVTLDWRLTF